MWRSASSPGGGVRVEPGLLNSEAVVFFWMVVGLAARMAEPAPSTITSSPLADLRPTQRRAPPRRRAALGLAGLALSRGGWPSRASGNSFGAPHASGCRRRRAVDVSGGDVRGRRGLLRRGRALARGRSGGEGLPGGSRLYVVGALVQRALGALGQVRESVLPLPAVVAFKWISVRVSPPFVPPSPSRGMTEAAWRLHPSGEQPEVTGRAGGPGTACSRALSGSSRSHRV